MIASVEEQFAKQQRENRQMRPVADDEDADSVANRFGDLVANRPGLFIVAAVSVGIAIGWIVKRKLG